MKKYKMVKEKNGLYRIVAVRDFGNIRNGDIGGLIQKEHNLSQYGNCWIGYNATVCGNARVEMGALVKDSAIVSESAVISDEVLVMDAATVEGNARVLGYATISGNARIEGNANVYGHARICGDAYVHGDSIVRGNAVVEGHAELKRNALIEGNAHVSRSTHWKKVIMVQGSRCTVTLDGEYINLGWVWNTPEYWLDNANEIGESNGYSPREIEEYKAIVIFLRNAYM